MGRTPHRHGGLGVLSCLHEYITTNSCASALVRRRRVLLRWPRDRRRRAWPDSADLSDCLSHGRIPHHEKLTGHHGAGIFQGMADKGLSHPRRPHGTAKVDGRRPVGTKLILCFTSPSWSRQFDQPEKMAGQRGYIGERQRSTIGNIGLNCQPARQIGGSLQHIGFSRGQAGGSE